MHEKLTHLLRLLDRPDPEIQERISAGIAANRKGSFRLTFHDGNGDPIDGTRVRLRLVRHDFLFGANIFMLDGYDSDALNRLYETRYLELFNAALVPFYWSDLEPEQGKPRFAADSPKVHRRPPPERVLDFCERHGITAKGHPLAWSRFYPSWLPTDREEVTRQFHRRFEEIARRYGGRVAYWDVVNEPLLRNPEVVMPRDYVFWSFQRCRELFPGEARLILNEAQTDFWERFSDDSSGLYATIHNLILRGAKLDAIGAQFHLFKSVCELARWRDRLLNPRYLLQVLDCYARFGLPIHISETTLPAYAALQGGDEFQAEALRHLYRLWFSHPAVEAIFWWNVPDGAAFGDEAQYRGGLLEADLSPKPAFEALRALTREEWHTSVEAEVDGDFAFEGFFGEYEIEIEGSDAPPTRVRLGKRDPRERSVNVALDRRRPDEERELLTRA